MAIGSFLGKVPGLMLELWEHRSSVYGRSAPLSLTESLPRQLGTLSVPGRRRLLIQAWENGRRTDPLGYRLSVPEAASSIEKIAFEYPKTGGQWWGKLSDNDGMFHNPHALRSLGKPDCIVHQIL